MEQYERFLEEARNNIKVADHLIYVTYIALNDNKLIIPIANNIYIASVNSVISILYHEKLYKQIHILPTNFDLRLEIFENEVMPKYNIKKEILSTIKELRMIRQEHKESPIEFSRKNNYIICTEDYNKIIEINIEKLKTHLKNTKILFDIASGLK